MAGHDFISFMSKDISLFNGKMLKTTLDVYVTWNTFQLNIDILENYIRNHSEKFNDKDHSVLDLVLFEKVCQSNHMEHYQ